MIEVEAMNKKYYRCQNCEFIFIDEKNIVNSIRELEQYELHENSIENEGYVNMFNKFIEEGISPYVKAHKRTLDFGSGPGPVLAKLLKKKGYESEIYDPYYSPNLPKGTFDLVTSTEVFEHFSNPLKEIELIVSLMKKNAYLSVMTNYHPKNDEKFKKWWYHRDPTHISFYTEKTFEYVAFKYNLDYIYSNGKNISVFKKK